MQASKVLAILALCAVCYVNAAQPKSSKRYAVYVPMNAPLTHGMMYLQYVQPRRVNGRLTDVGEVSAFAAGSTVAMGTQIRGGRDPDDAVDDDLSDTPLVPVETAPVPAEVPAEAASDSLPEQAPTTQADVDGSDDKAGDQPEPSGDKPTDNETAASDDEPTVTNVVSKPVAPSPPKKKVYVTLEQPRKPKPQALPTGGMFGIDLGRIGGGAIAIANSFSTGYGGAARSHATAYGSSYDTKARSRHR